MIKIKSLVLSILLLLTTVSLAQMAGQSDHTSNPASWEAWIADVDAIAAMVEAPSDDIRASEVQDLVALAASRTADTQAIVDHWNIVAAPYRWTEDLYEVSKGGPPGGRPFALMSVAIYDAVVASYKAKEAAGSWMVPMDSVDQLAMGSGLSSFPSEHAAVAIAASEVLSYVKPDHADRFRAMAEEAIQSRLLAGINIQSDIDAGRVIGQAVADAVIAYGNADDSNLPWEYSSRPEDTLYAVENPIAPNLGKAKTLAIENGAQFRAPPPPAYGSDELNAQLAEVTSVERTLPNMFQATNWARFDATFPVWTGLANRLLFESRQADNTPLVAKIYAGIAVARSDAEIACFDSKYTYWLARPVHLDPSFQPIVPTPPHPSYPSAHSCVTSAAAHSFAHFFPDSRDEALGLAQQAGQSRILGGIHYQVDNQAGLTLGESVAGVVIDKVMAMTGQGMGNMNSHTMMVKSPEDIAQAFILARNTYDHELAQSLFAAEPMIKDSAIKTPADYEAFYGYQATLDWEWHVDSCTTKMDGNVAKVHCPFAVASNLTKALVFDPIPDGSFDFTIQDGKITEFINNYPLAFWGPNVFAAFRSYIWANHSEDWGKMFSDTFPLGVTSEGQVLFRKYGEEFIEAMDAARANTTVTPAEEIGWSFFEARGNRDATTMAGLLSDEVKSFDVQGASNLEDYTNLLGWYNSLNWNWTASRCDQLGNGDGVAKVYCVTELENDWTRTAGKEPYNMGWGIRVKDGKVVGIFPEWNQNFVRTHYVSFRDYIQENHADDFDVMFLEGGPNIASGEQMHTLFAKHTKSFVNQ